MTERTGICKGGPMDGKTITGGDVMHFAFAEIKSTHRYQYDRGTYRHQGRRNVLNGFSDDVTVRICNECFMVREDYISTKCPACGSGWYSRG
jgi:hypothetical protein